MKKYHIIYADPPWHYKRCKGQGAAENHYPTLRIEQLCSIPVSEIAEKDCILFLWATFPQLPEALRLIDSWGFTYKSIGFLWLKQEKSDLVLWAWFLDKRKCRSMFTCYQRTPTQNFKTNTPIYYCANTGTQQKTGYSSRPYCRPHGRPVPNRIIRTSKSGWLGCMGKRS